MAFKFEEKTYKTWDGVMSAVAEAHPEALDDALVEIAEREIEEVAGKCWVCGAPVDGFVVPFLREKGVCSNYCLEDAGWDYS